MANLREIETKIKLYKKKYQEKKDDLIRAKAKKEQCEDSINELKKQLKEIGIKDVENPEKELSELESKIDENLEKVEQIISSLDL